jgi:hypothetical protein
VREGVGVCGCMCVRMFFWGGGGGLLLREIEVEGSRHIIRQVDSNRHFMI